MSKKSNAAQETQSEAPAETVGQVVEIGVGELKFGVPSRYAAGAVITDAEAAALNQLVRENLRNNFREVVKKKVEAAKAENRDLSDEEKAALTAEFAQKAIEYSFSMARGPRAPADPVGREAHKIAKSLVLASLAKKKIDVKSLAEGKLEELITQAQEKYPSIRQEAQRRIDEQKAFADSVLGLSEAA